ncbi:unnamed protein product [Hermetia illucens]|uniref:CSC1-like protein 2 n=2 Tax=Hermetia illucens TaxID=343691 RepID=A0A7R8UC15_HERIL|nr:unnamed protein product [Hermetia illucens]
MWVTLKLKKEEILAHSGPDAVHYLSFQQHLMLVMAIITLVSIVVILPINFQGTLSGDVNSFGHTTISNLEPQSPWLWVHVFVAIAYVPLVVLIMRRASGRNAFKKAPCRTIMVTHISSNDRNKSEIRNYIQQLFPDVNIEDIQLAFNIKKLTKKYAEYERCVEARIYCDNNRDRRSIRVTPVWYSCNTVDAFEYYQKEERNLAGEVARLRASALNEPLGIAFITVSTVEEAQSVIQHFRPGTYRDWQLAFAPQPLDIFWENLSVSTRRWYVKWIAVNLCLFIVLFFLTTPAYIVNLLDFLSLSQDDQQKYKVSPVVSEFLPTLMLWTLSALMPVIVAYSDKWLSHWTRSRQNYSVMTKTFGYLLFMILILPSLGLTSAQALLEWTVQGKDQYRWECIFLPDKGAFFVNYVITAAFIGTALELIRFPELIVYVWMLCTARSRAEIQYIRKSILIEFPFGIHYAWTVMVFTTSVVYSVACPLIMPFGMVYICFKYVVDRHNLFFAYGPSNMVSRNGGKIHSTAVTMTKFSVVLLLTILAAMAAIRRQGFDARAIVLILSLCMSLTLFAFMSPIKRCTMRRPSISNDRAPAPLYVADVLFARQTATTDHATYSGYGSDTRIELNSENGGDNSSVDI